MTRHILSRHAQTHMTFDPLYPHGYRNPGFSGVYIPFIISAQCTDCGYSLNHFISCSTLKHRMWLLDLIA